MSTQQSTILMAGIKFDYKEFEKTAEENQGKDYFDILVSPFDFVNFESSHTKNMQGLKCFFDVNGVYVIYGLPIEIAYENNGLNEIYSFNEIDIESYKKDCLIELYKNNIHTLLGINELNVDIHFFTYYC